MSQIIVMVLENLISETDADKSPMKMAFLGIVMSSISIFLSGIFSGSRGLFLVFLITMGMLPLMVKIMYKEENEGLSLEGNMWQKHGHFLKAYLAFFFAVTITLSFWFVALPADFTSNLFSDQINEIDKIRTGDFLGPVTKTAAAVITNNLYVMSIAFLLSFIFASGAVLIITWNASVLGVVVGQLAKDSFGLAAIPLTLSGFMIHGIPEILAYLVAGLAGGILSRSVEIRKIKSKEFMTILNDASALFLLSVILILIAGFIESLIILA